MRIYTFYVRKNGETAHKGWERWFSDVERSRDGRYQRLNKIDTRLKGLIRDCLRTSSGAEMLEVREEVETEDAGTKIEKDLRD